MPITRSDLRTKIQRRIGDTHSTTFYSSAFYNDIIDSRVLSRSGLISRYVPNYYIKHTNYTGVDDATDSTYEFYQFPTDYRTFVKLERQYGTASNRIYQTIRLVNAEEQERYRLANHTLLALPDSLTNFEQCVSVWDNRFRLVPAPVNNSYEYQLKYLRRPVDASADESLLDIPDEWREVIILDCAIYILTQTGDPLADRLRNLLQEELFNLKNEYSRKTMDIEGIPTLEIM